MTRLMDGPETPEPPSPDPASHETVQTDSRPQGGAISDQSTPNQSATEPVTTCQIAVDDPRSLLSAPDAAWIADSLARAIVMLGASGDIRVRLVNDQQMTQEHGQALDDWTTTDVLTFDLREQETDPLDTDLFLCVDEAERQSQLRGHSVRDELLLYAVHGVLHCMGYDDHDDEEFARMHKKEDELLSSIGVGPRYASETPGLER